ncbi:hypothetical protein CLG96_14665 [Sphingomonas oleivorans]|uniref:Protein-glutamine gamma-glutamyltransferase-like C-terminal domain-containing protein n=1 Tax=Sphingomonas oleivorans TaxID=1735121 RepID=A0A2T5FVI1_9SPHN|nr:hypothetical protein CLG96_14665 [Sphingomonas oleivorans]
MGPHIEGDAFAAAHERLRSDSAIQFDLPKWAPPPQPEWMAAVGRALKAIFRVLGPYAPYLRYLLWAAIGCILLYLLWRLYRAYGHLLRLRAPSAETAEEEIDWRPEAAPARALLREADRLAADGRFAEAVHLLLQRSIEDIERHRPRLVRPAFTSRDIAAAAALPVAARATFATLARTVERSLFGRRVVDAADWQACRTAYEEFAFPGLWR